jgi:hypothetical protein
MPRLDPETDQRIAKLLKEVSDAIKTSSSTPNTLPSQQVYVDGTYCGEFYLDDWPSGMYRTLE